MKKIDFEFHVYCPELIKFLETRTEPPMVVENPRRLVYRDGIFIPFIHFPGHRYTAEEKLCSDASFKIQEMDEAGVDVAVVSTSNLIEELPREDSIKYSKLTNDYIAEMVSRYPDRFIGTACLPVPYVDAAIEELERCAKMGFKVWHTHSNYGDKHLYDEELEPLLAKAEELGFSIYLHPHFSKTPDMLGVGFVYPGAGLGFGQDVMKTAVRFMANGAFDRYPKLKLIIGHLGEYFPFILERIDNRLGVVPDPLIKMQHTPSYYFKNKNIFVTTSGNASKAAFECTKSVLGIDSIMFGSDYPYESYKEDVAFIENLGLSDEDLEKVFCKNFETYILGE